MTVSSSTSKAGPYAGNGSTTAFAFAFYTQAAADITVVKTDSSGVDATLTQGSDFFVALNPDQTSSPGGSVTLVVAPASGCQITVLRNIALTQNTNLPNQGGWYQKVVENALDKLTMGLQQLAEQVNRAVKGSVANPQTADQLIAQISTTAAASAASAAASSASATAADASATSASNNATLAASSAASISAQRANTLLIYSTFGGF